LQFALTRSNSISKEKKKKLTAHSLLSVGPHLLPLSKVIFELDSKFESFFTEGCGLGNN